MATALPAWAIEQAARTAFPPPRTCVDLRAVERLSTCDLQAELEGDGHAVLRIHKRSGPLLAGVRLSAPEAYDLAELLARAARHHERDMPFILVELPSLTWQPDPDEWGHECIADYRELQRRAYRAALPIMEGAREMLGA